MARVRRPREYGAPREPDRQSVEALEVKDEDDRWRFSCDNGRGTPRKLYHAGDPEHLGALQSSGSRQPPAKRKDRGQ
ncbi:hypothetical protein VTN02DRAFT_872 [Thermoascus thermophilus]